MKLFNKIIPPPVNTQSQDSQPSTNAQSQQDSQPPTNAQSQKDGYPATTHNFTKRPYQQLHPTSPALSIKIVVYQN
jgi:hypothetical protein